MARADGTCVKKDKERSLMLVNIDSTVISNCFYRADAIMNKASVDGRCLFPCSVEIVFDLSDQSD